MTIQKRYAEYLERFGLAYQKPMSFEVFQESATAQDVKTALVEALTTQAMTSYQGFVKTTATKDEALELVKTMKEAHDILYAAAGNDDEATAHIKAFEAVRAQLLMPYKKIRSGYKRPFVANNIYDDDDRPATLR